MKTGFWLRNGKGKLAGATVYQQNGETVMREVVSPTNPKTEKQIIQRIIMHTVMQAYSKMKAICDHSFEGLKKGQETMSYFMSQNVGFAREKVATMQASGINFINMYNFVPLGLKGYTPNQYQVSMGSLPRVTCQMREDEDGQGFVIGITENTYANVISTLGLQRGDQLTFLMIDAPANAIYGQYAFHFCRVILDPTNADFSQAPLSTPFIDANGRINLPSVRNEGNFHFTFDAAKGLGFAHTAGLTASSCAVIVSRKMGDKWLRSTAYLVYQAVEEYSLGECLEMAQGGTSSTIYAAADAYLNNAGQGGGAAAEAGESSGSGSSSQSGTNPAVSSVSINGVNATMGTECVLSTANAEPDATVIVRTNTAANGATVIIKSGSDTAGHGVVNNGQATINANDCALDATYAIYLQASGSTSQVATGYTFSFTEQSQQGGGGNGFEEGS